MTGDALELEHVSKRFGEVTAVHDLSLSVRRGEFFSLLGPSGCGKTTTLRMLAGFEEPSEGRLLLDGIEATQIPPFKRPTNLVFQNYALFPHMNVYRNVSFGPRRARLSKDEIDRRVREALRTVRMEGFADRMPAQLSGGQQQRVALARALVNDPLVLLLDEPLGALDLKLRREMQIELKRIQREVGISFVYVTHDQEEAMTMSDRIAVMSHGRIEQLGTPRDVYFRPTTRFVADFIGTANLLPARLERAGEQPEVRMGDLIVGAGSMGVLDGRAPTVGDSVSLMVRPESLMVADEPPEGLFSVPVVIEDVIFQGTGSRLDLLALSHVPIVAVVAADEARWRPGDRAYAAWEPARGHIVPEPTS